MFTSRSDLVAALLGCLGAMGASAHGLDQREASVVVMADRVVTTTEVDAGTGQDFLAELVVRDEQGRRRVGRVASTHPASADDHVLLRIEHALERPPRWVSFHLAPGQAPTARARRVELTITDESAAGGAAQRSVTLTSGGNVETLRFGSPEPVATCGPALLDRPDRLQSVQAILRSEDAGRRLEIVIPLRLLESWLPIPRASPDEISVAEQQAARQGIVDLVAARVRMSGGGNVGSAALAGVTFLGLDDAATSAPAPRPLGAWTARVAVALHFPQDGPIEWDLWNARVLTASVVVMKGGACEERRLSTYAPSLR